MKSRTLFTIFFIAMFVVIIALPKTSQAVTFPKTYSGLMRYRVDLTSGGTSYHCEMDPKIEITLLADGTLIAPYDKMRLSNTPPLCEITPTGQTGTMNGTHNLQGSFEITVGGISESITGAYDDDSISGSANDGKTSISFTLQADSQPPQITIEPATHPDFQISVLTGNGFTVKIRKENGVKDSQGNWKLNWSTLVFTTDDADNTKHFSDTAINQGIVFASVDEKEVRFNIIPDPKVFMLKQNVFNILSNGEHKIALQICDTDGRCGKSEYTLYFGPFIFVKSVTDMRCTNEGDFLNLKALAGNMGFASSSIELYVALINADQPDEYWCYDSVMWYEKVVVPVVSYSLPSAYLETISNFPMDLRETYPRIAPFPSGNYRFLALVIDKNSKAVWQAVTDVKTCSRFPNQ